MKRLRREARAWAAGHAEGVPASYVMQPFEAKLSYNGKSWITVPLEVGHNEIGDAEDPDMRVPKEASDIFVSLGFPPLDPMPFMKLTYQVAQKLHGLTEKGSERAHGLGGPSGDHGRRATRPRRHQADLCEALLLQGDAAAAAPDRATSRMGRELRLCIRGSFRARVRGCRRLGQRVDRASRLYRGWLIDDLHFSQRNTSPDPLRQIGAVDFRVLVQSVSRSCRYWFACDDAVELAQECVNSI